MKLLDEENNLIELFEEAKKLIELSADNPEFICKFTLLKDKLFNFRSNNKQEMEEASTLIRKLNEKCYRHKQIDIANAYNVFTNTILNRRSDENYLFKVTIHELLEARKVAEKFKIVANSTIAKGMHKYHNDYALKYARELADRFLKLYKAKDERYWTEYRIFKSYIVQAVNKGVLTLERIPDIAKIIKLIDKDFNEKTNVVGSLEKLNAFSQAENVVDRINLREMTSEMIYLSITDILKLTPYYEECRKNIDDKYVAKEITAREYEDYSAKLRSELDALLSPDKTNTVAPLMVYRNYLDGLCEVQQLLEFSEEEMLNAYTLASKFIKYFSNESIEDMMINFRKLAVTNIKNIPEATRKWLDKGSKVLLDLLLSYSIITPEQYEKDIDILQEG